MSNNLKSISESTSESMSESKQELPKPTCKTCNNSKPPVQEESIKKVYWIVGGLSSCILILCIIFMILFLKNKQD